MGLGPIPNPLISIFYLKYNIIFNNKKIIKEILNTAKKIRKVLINFIDVELRKSIKKNNNVLIDSKSSEELSKKYKQFSDYKMEIIETYNGFQTNNAITSYNNFYRVVVSYSKINNIFSSFI